MFQFEPEGRKSTLFHAESSQAGRVLSLAEGQTFCSVRPSTDCKRPTILGGQSALPRLPIQVLISSRNSLSGCQGGTTGEEVFLPSLPSLCQPQVARHTAAPSTTNSEVGAPVQRRCFSENPRLGCSSRIPSAGVISPHPSTSS